MLYSNKAIIGTDETEISLPYGRGQMNAVIQTGLLNGIFNPSLPDAPENQSEEVERALDHPFESQLLEKLAAGKRRAVIIASDHTRPVPSRVIIPALLRRLRKGAPDIDVTILVATGFHRATTHEELIAKFGPEIVENEKIVIHNGSDRAGLVKLKPLPSGGNLIINRFAVECDLLLAEGFIEPHFFAGFSGGRKSVLPGIASRETILANHCSEFIQSRFARTGILENNPIHQDMDAAAKQAKLAFILNVVIDEHKNIVRAFAGDFRAAHKRGCDFLGSRCRIEVPESDIVITGNGGYPLDQNIYQAVKGMTAAEAVCREGGVIVVAASCCDGHGGESFYRAISGESPAALLARLAAVPRELTEPDQWESQILARILNSHHVIVASSDCPARLLESMHFHAAESLEEALAEARRIAGSSARIAVIPNGVSVIAEKSKRRSDK